MKSNNTMMKMVNCKFVTLYTQNPNDYSITFEKKNVLKLDGKIINHW